MNGTWQIKMTKKNTLKTSDSQLSPSSPILINMLSLILEPKKKIPIKAVIEYIMTTARIAYVTAECTFYLLGVTNEFIIGNKF